MTSRKEQNNVEIRKFRLKNPVKSYEGPNTKQKDGIRYKNIQGGTAVAEDTERGDGNDEKD